MNALPLSWIPNSRSPSSLILQFLTVLVCMSMWSQPLEVRRTSFAGCFLELDLGTQAWGQVLLIAEPFRLLWSLYLDNDIFSSHQPRWKVLVALNPHFFFSFFFPFPVFFSFFLFLSPSLSPSLSRQSLAAGSDLGVSGVWLKSLSFLDLPAVACRLI